MTPDLGGPTNQGETSLKDVSVSFMRRKEKAYLLLVEERIEKSNVEWTH
jgi:hypothetical protein